MITAIELFAGAMTLRHNRPEWNVIEEDIRKTDFSPYKGIDLVTGGFPCQTFSYAGKRMGFDDVRGTLFYEYARCIKETNPKAFIAENVKGLLTHDKGKTFQIAKCWNLFLPADAGLIFLKRLPWNIWGSHITVEAEEGGWQRGCHGMNPA